MRYSIHRLMKWTILVHISSTCSWCKDWYYDVYSGSIGRIVSKFHAFSWIIRKKVENQEHLMFECWIKICLKVPKFHVFFRKNRKKVENQKHLMFECCIDKCFKVYKFHVFFRKNRMSCIFNIRLISCGTASTD